MKMKLNDVLSETFDSIIAEIQEGLFGKDGGADGKKPEGEDDDKKPKGDDEGKDPKDKDGDKVIGDEGKKPKDKDKGDGSEEEEEPDGDEDDDEDMKEHKVSYFSKATNRPGEVIVKAKSAALALKTAKAEIKEGMAFKVK